MRRITNVVATALVVALGLFSTACQEPALFAPNGEQGSSIQEIPVSPSITPSSFSGTTVDLLAGQDMDVGDVTITDDGTDLTIEITVDSPWCLVEFHFAAAGEEDDIPQTNKGNPQPGQFDKYESGDPWTGLSGEPDCVTSGSWSFPLPDGDIEPGDDIVVAVHTVVQKTMPGDDVQLQSDDAGSGLLTTVTAYRAGDEASFTTLSGNPAVLADQPDDYPNGLAEDPAVDTWGNAQNAIGQTMLSDGADWIWKTARVAEPLQGEVVEFSRSFDIPGVPTSGTLRMTCDNGFEAFVNGTSVGTGDVAGTDWQLSELLEANVETQGWQSAHEFDITSELVSGSNELLFWGANESFEDNPSTPADAFHNPGGCLYTLDYSYDVLVEETAWADGQPFQEDKGDWGTYISYTTNDCEATVTNGGFEMPVVSTNENWNVFNPAQTGWDIEWVGTQTSFDSHTRPEDALLEIQRDPLLLAADDGVQKAELDSDWTGPPSVTSSAFNGEPASVKISQELATCPGVEYRLNYKWASRTGDDVLNVTFGAATDQKSGSGSADVSWNDGTLDFTATGATTTISFEDPATGDADNSLGMFLDAVSVAIKSP